MNLQSNALKFTKDSGDITIIAELVMPQERKKNRNFLDFY
jgi:hypothetical protein